MLSTAFKSLSENQLRSYRERGFLILPAFFSRSRIDALLAEAEILRASDYVALDNLRCRFMPSVHQTEPLFEVFDPIIDISPLCAAIAHDPALLAVFGEIYGEPAKLFKDKLIYKPPGAKGYGIHQDWISWPGFPRSFLTVLVALDPADAGNGCTQVYEGLHRKGCLAQENGQFHEFTPAQMGDALRIDLILEPGDLAIFTGYTPHCSAPNASPRDRRQLFLSYNAESDGGDLRDWHYQDFFQRRRKWLTQDSRHVYFR